MYEFFKSRRIWCKYEPLLWVRIIIFAVFATQEGLNEIIWIAL